MQQHKFPKSEKLQKNWEFQKVYRQGKKHTGKYLTIHILGNQPSRKIGISASRKIGKAVKRNRAKRLIRESYRLNKHLLGNDIQLVVAAKPEIIGLKYKDVEEDFLYIIKKANLKQSLY